MALTTFLCKKNKIYILHRIENQRIIITQILIKEEEASLIHQPQQNESLLRGGRNRPFTTTGEFLQEEG